MKQDREWRLLVVWGGVEAEIQDMSFTGRSEVLAVAREHYGDRGDQDGLHAVFIDWKDREIHIEDFSNGELREDAE